MPFKYNTNYFPKAFTDPLTFNRKLGSMLREKFSYNDTKELKKDILLSLCLKTYLKELKTEQIYGREP